MKKISSGPWSAVDHRHQDNEEVKPQPDNKEAKRPANLPPTVAPGIEDDVLEEGATREEIDHGEYTEVYKLEVEPRREG